MNILLYVLIIITAISIMTFTRLQTFLTTVGIRKEYVCFMEEKDRAEINKMQKKQYTKHTGEGTQHEQKGQKVDALSFLNFRVFVDKDFREGNQSYYQTIRRITELLLQNLYHNHKFFEEVEEERKDVITELLDQIQSVSEKQKIKNSDDLKGLNLEDPQLQELFAKMLEGGKDINIVDACAESNRKGYRSLFDFIRVVRTEKNPYHPIRIQLVPEKLLEAIFKDPTTVEEIIEIREKYRKEPVKSGTTEQQVASNAFESQFKIRLPKDLDSNFFNFSITKSVPRS